MCENNWVREIATLTRADRRIMVELREEMGVQRSLTERLVRSRLQWAGHVEMMADERLPKRAAALCEEGRRRRGRLRIRWKDCVKIDVNKVGEGKTGRRRQETDKGEKDYQMRRCTSLLTKGNRGREKYYMWITSS